MAADSTDMAVSAASADISTDASPQPSVSATTAPATTQTRVDFHWEHIGEGWHILVYLTVALILAWWARRRYGPAPAGWVGRLARGCRIATIITLVALIAGPAWRHTSITAIPGRLLLAVDRSASMDRPDGPNGQPRIAIAQSLASELGEIQHQQNVLLDWRSFGGTTDAIDPATVAHQQLTTPGAQSPLGDELARLADPGRCDHIIMVSDGRVTTGTDLATVGAHLRDRNVGLSILAIGDTVLDADLWIDQVVVNRSAALDEREPVLVRLSGRALDKDQPVSVSVSVDGTEQEATTAEIVTDHGTTCELSARLAAQFHKEGESVLRIDVRQGEHTASREIRVTVTERRLRVLILASRPRYELRYLREALRRDHTISLHAYLGDGRRWRRWSEDGPADHLPLSTVEIRDYDVILLGDVRPDQFEEDQLRAIDAAVRKNGSGLIWLLGETGATAGFMQQPLGDLLPTRLGSVDTITRGFSEQRSRHPQRTPASEAIGLFDPGEVDWNNLPALLGAAPLGEIRPGSEILMTDADNEPLVVARNYPPGRAIIIGIDDTWRWRRNVGDSYLQRFHGQLLRYASGGRRLGRHTWRLSATPRRAVPGETVSLSLVPIGPPADSGSDRMVAALVSPDGTDIVIPMTRADGGFTAEVPAPSAGSWRMRMIDGPEARLVDTGELEVQPPGAEMRDPRADPEALAALARSSGGRVYTDAKALVADLPDLARNRIESLPPRGLWDTPWAFLLILLFTTIEWSLRRWHRLP